VQPAEHEHGDNMEAGGRTIEAQRRARESATATIFSDRKVQH
jgi:hypothetical protein